MDEGRDAAEDRKRQPGSINFRLGGTSLGFSVDVCLRDFGGRWIAIAENAGGRELGLGATARTALRAAISGFGPRATAALLADPVLLDVSLQVR